MPKSEIPMENQDEVIVVRKEEDIRASVISEYGFDEEADAERIEKLVTKELDHDKKLSSAIGAKIKHRTEAEELKKKIPPEVKPPVVEKKEEGLTVDDVFALTTKEVKHKEDVELAKTWAKALNTTVAAILENDEFNQALNIRQEKRRSAEVANIGPGRAGSHKVSVDELVNKAKEEGIVPESDEDIDRMMRAIVSTPTKK